MATVRRSHEAAQGSGLAPESTAEASRSRHLSGAELRGLLRDGFLDSLKDDGIVITDFHKRSADDFAQNFGEPGLFMNLRVEGKVGG